ncbi:EamA family transporter [Psychrobacillus sp. BM2]|uniref:EamA family transporter n=1 Tax=Psychrobacillus sp. BM2 TaxID=3400421 RepID=UPI003B017D6C
MHKVGATKAALLLNFEPFEAMVFGFFLLGISIQLLQLIGAYIIVIGVSISL